MKNDLLNISFMIILFHLGFYGFIRVNIQTDVSLVTRSDIREIFKISNFKTS